MTKDKPIRYSTWHISEKIKTKTKTHIVREVLIAGEQKHIPVIARTERYVARMHGLLVKTLGRRIKRENIKVIKIEIQQAPDFGLGVGCLDEGLMKKLGL